MGNSNVLGFNRRSLLAGGAAAAALPFLGRAARADAAPKHGGTFRMALAGASTSDTFEPGSIWDTGIQNISAQLRDLMVEVTPDGRLEASLAESWEPDSKAMTWTFNLRKGVEFHNGKSFTSADVLFTMNHHLAPDSTSGAKGVLSNVASVKADGPYRVIYTMKQPDVDFPYTLSDYHMVIMQDGTTDWLTCVGTSAYVFKSFQPGSQFMATKNPNYWRSDRGWFDEVHTLFVNDTAARMNALMSGQVDSVNRVDLSTVNLLKRNPHIAIQNIEGTKQFTLPMLCDVAPFSDNNVRMALKYAINRQHIVDHVLNGYGVVGNDHPIAKINRYYDASLPQREYDADKAQFYLKKAGLTNPTFQLYVSDAAFAGATDASQVYQEDARQAGVNIELVRTPADGWWKNVWMVKPWCVSFWSGRATEDAIFSLAYAKDSNDDESHWANPKFNELLVAARGELDDGKRRQMYYEMQAICRDDSGGLTPTFLNLVQATTTKVSTPKVSGFGEMDNDRCAHKWWFNA